MIDYLPFRIGSLLTPIEELQKLKILIVGVGGIGCELLKVLCKMPIGSIHIIDMDTIEISNLNRQFLFKAEHKGKSKAITAQETIKIINPYLNIEAHHKNIRELPISYFKQFNYLIMALDNIETRNYVNKIGVRLNIPVIDAGTLGFKGNVHIILPQQTKCYSCEPKVSSQKSFPVCTIRMRPEKPIHCIVWAKMLFEVLFSGQEVNNDMKDLAVLAESGDENSLLKELLFTEINNIKNAKTDSDSILAKLYVDKIKPIEEELLIEEPKADIDDYDSFDVAKIDIRVLISLAKQSFVRLLKQKKEEKSIIFEKGIPNSYLDDDNIIHFISALANLRMMCFSIATQSFNEVKNMAGNIVPAIASTNSIVSGLQVVEMIKLFSEAQDNLRSYYVQNQSYKVRALKIEKPLPTCSICSPLAQPLIFEINMNSTLFSKAITRFKSVLSELGIECEFSINQGEKELYNSEEPNEKILGKTIIEISNGSFEMEMIVTDEDTSLKVCSLWIIHDDGDQFNVHNTDQIKLQIEANKNKPKQGNEEHKKDNAESDSDEIKELNNGKEEDDEIEITEVRRPVPAAESKQDESKEGEEDFDKVEKRVKYN